MSDFDTFKTDIHKCARCGKTHESIEFIPLLNAPEDASHFAMCPETHQPIICQRTRNIIAIPVNSAAKALIYGRTL